MTILTQQKIHLLGMITEAIHTPFMSERAISIDNASYIFRTMADLGEEITFKEDGMVQTRAKNVLEDARNILRDIQREGLFLTLEQGKFAGIKRGQDRGKGLDGVVQKDSSYFNPFISLLLGRGE
ncbi:Lysine 5,6-aminomutase alpha subunit [anaerobic digester metagenome]